MLSQVTRRLVTPSRLGSFRCFSDVSARFAAAQTKLSTLTDDPGNEVKLKMYGLFKQVRIYYIIISFLIIY